MNSALRFHVEELTNENIAKGMCPEDARRRAESDSQFWLSFCGLHRPEVSLRETRVTARNLTHRLQITAAPHLLFYFFSPKEPHAVAAPESDS